MGKDRSPLVTAKALYENPSADQLRQLTAEMPNARETEFGNLNVRTRVTARSKASTFLATDHPERHSDPTIDRVEYERISRMQDEYVRDREMIAVDGFIGNDPAFRVATRLVVERSNANIAAMQQQLYYSDDSIGGPSFDPVLTVIYTPGLPIPGYPNDRLIAVDLETGTTRVFHSDYFGESKKAGLRMWNKIVYDRGGLALHAGCKLIPTGHKGKVVLIIGLSGTGKTTTTFTRQNDSHPVQDDFVALMPGGKVYASEAGCFAKTFGLDPEDEPIIYRAVTDRVAYLENAGQRGDKVDFSDDSYTRNGRATFPLTKVEGAADARDLGRADILLILNRNENVIPAVARLRGAQAAAFFMLGETQGTSAGGKEEAGKFLRVPGTNPFFPLLQAQQGNRMLELLQSCDLEVFLLNTGRIGGPESDPRSRKVKIRHSSAIVKAVAEGTVRWVRDPDFGYDVAEEVPGIPETESALLQPRRLYAKQGRLDEYEVLVQQLKSDRLAYLQNHPQLRPELARALR